MVSYLATSCKRATARDEYRSWWVVEEREWGPRAFLNRLVLQQAGPKGAPGNGRPQQQNPSSAHRTFGLVNDLGTERRSTDLILSRDHYLAHIGAPPIPCPNPPKVAWMRSCAWARRMRPHGMAGRFLRRSIRTTSSPATGEHLRRAPIASIFCRAANHKTPTRQICGSCRATLRLNATQQNRSWSTVGSKKPSPS